MVAWRIACFGPLGRCENRKETQQNMPDELVYDPITWRIQEVERWSAEYTRWRTAYRESAVKGSVRRVAMVEAAAEVERRSDELNGLLDAVQSAKHVTPAQAGEIAHISQKVASARAVADSIRANLAALAIEKGGAICGK